MSAVMRTKWQAVDACVQSWETDMPYYQRAETFSCDADSAGYGYLTQVVEDVLSRVYEDEDITSSFARLLADSTWEIVSQAIPVYTAQKWQAFIDLGLWAEDVSESIGENMTADALVDAALAIAGERLISALLADLDEAREDDLSLMDED